MGAIAIPLAIAFVLGAAADALFGPVTLVFTVPFIAGFVVGKLCD
jgi:hypothetical protein